MTPADILTSLNRTLAVHKDALDQLAGTLLGQGYIVADPYVRAVHDSSHFGGKAGVLALGPARDDLCGVLHFTRERARAVADALNAADSDLKVQALHVTDWHRRAVDRIASTIEVLTADGREGVQPCRSEWATR